MQSLGALLLDLLGQPLGALLLDLLGQPLSALSLYLLVQSLAALSRLGHHGRHGFGLLKIYSCILYMLFPKYIFTTVETNNQTKAQGDKFGNASIR